MKQTVLDVFAFQRGYLDLLLAGIPGERHTEQPTGARNHPAWQVGHLAVVSDAFAQMLGHAPGVPEAWQGLFGAGSKPVADPAAYPRMPELLNALDAARSRLTDAFRAADDDALGRANPMEILRQGLPTVGHFAVFGMLTHEATHLGQFAAWRRAAGMPEALDAFRARHANAAGA